MAGYKQRNDSAIARHASLVGLVMSWFAGFTALFLGGICLFIEIRDGVAVHLKINNTWREILPLLLNILVTLLNDSMGYIHSCTLRWALQREGLLEFNSNLRLLRVSKSSKPNGMVANVICFVGIIMAYGSTSLVFLTMDPTLAELLERQYPHESVDHEGVHINSVALFTLAVGLISQAIITNWAMGTAHIPTWSSNPLAVARACIQDEHDGHRIVPRTGRCMMSVHLAKEGARSLRPVPRQSPMITANLRIRRILILLFVTPTIGAIWGGATARYVTGSPEFSGSSWSPMPNFAYMAEDICGRIYCGTSVVNIWWTTTNGILGTFGGGVLIMFAQSIVTMSLLSAELLVNLSRDEEIYRRLIGPKGASGHYNSIWAAFTSPETIVLFLLKSGVHWMFGLAINLQCMIGVNMYPPQIFYFTGFALITAIFGLYLSLRRPKGYLPATYGHIQTMADVIDEWPDSGRMFWGEKDHGDPHRGFPGHTGTSADRLIAPDENQLYGGERAVDGSETPRQSGSTLTVPAVVTPTAASQPVSNPQQKHTYTWWAQQQRIPPRQSSIRHLSTRSLNSTHSEYSNYSEQSNESAQPFLKRP